MRGSSFLHLLLFGTRRYISTTVFTRVYQRIRAGGLYNLYNFDHDFVTRRFETSFLCEAAFMPILTLSLFGLVFLGAEPQAGPPVEDVFGRTLNGQSLVLVDWEGYMANPAIRLLIGPRPDAALPAKVVLRASDPRIYFDLPGDAGQNGARKEFLFKAHAKIPVSIAIFPDRDGRDEEHELHVECVDGNDRRTALSLPIRVIDQDREDRGLVFSVKVDFSQDRTGFFQDAAARAVIIRAANDWAYFFDDMQLAGVPAGAEQTFLWNPDGFKTGRYRTNEDEYRGFLLYAYGIKGDEIRSGGEPSRAGGFQRSGEADLPIRRSGGVEVEVRGNYNTLGWLMELDDADWWRATNLNGMKHDLYSIVHHEIGHALIFNPGHTCFAAAKLLGTLRNARLTAYVGSAPPIDRTDHLRDVVDPESLRGAFGNEYHGKTPRGRWLITKTDLLSAEAVGYVLRETSAFAQLKLTTDILPKGAVGAHYSALVRATGGIPFYNWEVIDGQLPEGLALDRFSGEIDGIPKRTGSSAFTVRVREYNEKSPGKSQRLKIEIE